MTNTFTVVDLIGLILSLLTFICVIFPPVTILLKRMYLRINPLTLDTQRRLYFSLLYALLLTIPSALFVIDDKLDKSHWFQSFIRRYLPVLCYVMVPMIIAWIRPLAASPLDIWDVIMIIVLFVPLLINDVVPSWQILYEAVFNDRRLWTDFHSLYLLAGSMCIFIYSVLRPLPDTGIGTELMIPQLRDILYCILCIILLIIPIPILNIIHVFDPKDQNHDSNLGWIILNFICIFIFVSLPLELFFRGALQNLIHARVEVYWDIKRYITGSKLPVIYDKHGNIQEPLTQLTLDHNRDEIYSIPHTAQEVRVLSQHSINNNNNNNNNNNSSSNNNTYGTNGKTSTTNNTTTNNTTTNNTTTNNTTSRNIYPSTISILPNHDNKNNNNNDQIIVSSLFPNEQQQSTSSSSSSDHNKKTAYLESQYRASKLVPTDGSDDYRTLLLQHADINNYSAIDNGTNSVQHTPLTNYLTGELVNDSFDLAIPLTSLSTHTPSNQSSPTQQYKQISTYTSSSSNINGGNIQRSTSISKNRRSLASRHSGGQRYRRLSQSGPSGGVHGGRTPSILGRTSSSSSLTNTNGGFDVYSLDLQDSTKNTLGVGSSAVADNKSVDEVHSPTWPTWRERHGWYYDHRPWYYQILLPQWSDYIVIFISGLLYSSAMIYHVMLAVYGDDAIHSLSSTKWGITWLIIAYHGWIVGYLWRITGQIWCSSMVTCVFFFIAAHWIQLSTN